MAPSALKGVYQLPYHGPDGAILLVAIDNCFIEVGLHPRLSRAALDAAWRQLEDRFNEQDRHAVLCELRPDGTPVVHWRVMDLGAFTLLPEPPRGPRLS